ncbi:MAG: putative zinc-binding metallopeptidase [Prevotella sp.]|nr:putative zinc-binding metallopeptidase [Prevotella sp.]
MKKNILYLLPLLLLSLGFVSCSEDELSEKSVIVVDSYEQNDFDKWLEANYVKPYNINFKYRYEEIESDYNYYTVPAEMEQSIKMAHIVKHLCIDTYNEVARDGIVFTRSYFPKEFFLIGVWEYRNNGTYILGTAEGGKKILLAGINFLNSVLDGSYDRSRSLADNLNYYYVKTIHHEFTHILNQTKEYPADFKLVTGSGYVADSWSDEPYDATDVFLKRGFISSYAQHSDTEDFAEMVSVYITNTADWWESRLQRADGTYADDPKQVKTGRELIEAKLDIVRNYMLEIWGIDLDEARAAIQRRQSEILNGQISLTDLTIK